MNAQLTFDLTDPDDRMAHLRCVKAMDMALVLWEIHYNLYKRIENEIAHHSEQGTPMDAFEAQDLIFEALRELFDEHGINVDELTV